MIFAAIRSAFGVKLKHPETIAMRYLPIANRHVHTVFVHSTATKPSMDVTAAMIDEWHKQRGWLGIGYHLVIKRDGTTERGRPIDKIGAHTGGHNAGSIGIVMAGGVDDAGKPDANFTPEQFDTLSKVLDEIEATYPNVLIKGHRDVAATACPSFNVRRWRDTGEVQT